MANEAESFWTDIKRYEDMLAKDPSSYCFAPLAELYRKVGLLDDAINTARKGIDIHPEYVGGFMSLGRACFEKGDKEESRAALEKVVRVTPDNLLAQKLLSQLYIDAGESALAGKSLETILALNPDDLESKVAYEALCRSTERFSGLGNDLFPGEDVPAENGSWEFDDESLLEEVEIIEDLADEIDEDEMPGAEGAEIDFAAPPLTVAVPEMAEEPATAVKEEIPFVTSTVAELYVAQGFLDKARTIYTEMLGTDPTNEGIKARIAELDRRLAGVGGLSFAGECATASAAVPDLIVDDTAPAAPSPLGNPPGDVVAVLDGWLDTIGRIRQCRSGKH